MFIMILLCCGRFNSKASLLSHSQLQQEEEEVAENCFLEQDSRKTRNMNMQNFLTRMNSNSTFIKFMGDNHKSGWPNPTVDHSLAKIRYSMQPHPCRLLSWQNISLAQLDQIEMRRWSWGGIEIRFLIALLRFQGTQKLSFRSSQLTFSLITATLVQYYY